MTLAAAFDRLLWRTGRPAPTHPETAILPTLRSDIRVRDSGGNRPTVVFLCDPPVIVEAYDDLIAAFHDEYRVLIMELPGFGFSKASSSTSSRFRESVEALETALASLRLDSFVICGPCICGFVAAELARRERLPVKGIVMMQTPDLEGLRAWRSRMDPKHLLRTPFIGQLVVRSRASRLARFWIKYASGKDYAHETLEAHCLRTLQSGGSYPLATMLQLWNNGPSDDPLHVPGIVVWGRQDRSHRTTPTESTMKHLPDAAVFEFSDCGHFVELEDPQGFASAIRPFLRSHLGNPVD